MLIRHRRLSEFVTILMTIFSVLLTSCQNQQIVERTDKEDKEESMDYVSYLKDAGLDLTGFLEDEEGDLTDEFVYFRFRIVEGKREAVEERLTTFCGKAAPLNNSPIPGYNGHALAQKLRSEELLSKWMHLTQGEGEAKTESSEFYVTEVDGTQYLYYFH